MCGSGNWKGIDVCYEEVGFLRRGSRLVTQSQKLTSDLSGVLMP